MRAAPLQSSRPRKPGPADGGLEGACLVSREEWRPVNPWVTLTRGAAKPETRRPPRRAVRPQCPARDSFRVPRPAPGTVGDTFPRPHVLPEAFGAAIQMKFSGVWTSRPDARPPSGTWMRAGHPHASICSPWRPGTQALPGEGPGETWLPERNFAHRRGIPAGHPLQQALPLQLRRARGGLSLKIDPRPESLTRQQFARRGSDTPAHFFSLSLSLGV